MRVFRDSGKRLQVYPLQLSKDLDKLEDFVAGSTSYSINIILTFSMMRPKTSGGNVKIMLTLTAVRELVGLKKG